MSAILTLRDHIYAVIFFAEAFSRTIIPKLYEKERLKLKELFAAVNYNGLSLTSDIWTARNQDAYIDVTAHFITNFKIESKLLDTIYFPERHTADNILDKLDTVHAYYSYKRKLIPSVPTRWNSEYDKEKRLIENMKPLMISMVECKITSSRTIEQWEEMKELINILEPFKKATEVLSGESYPTLSSVIPILHGIITFLDRLDENLHSASAPSERVWSDGGNTVTSARESLLPDTFRMLMFIRSNRK